MHRVYLIAAIISFLFIFAGCASLHTVDKYADGRTTETDVFEVLKQLPLRATSRSTARRRNEEGFRVKRLGFS